MRTRLTTPKPPLALSARKAIPPPLALGTADVAADMKLERKSKGWA